MWGVDSFSVQDIDRWQVRRMGSVPCGRVSVEDVSHFFQRLVCYCFLSWGVREYYYWSMADGSKGVHIGSGVVVVSVFRR